MTNCTNFATLLKLLDLDLGRLTSTQCPIINIDTKFNEILKRNVEDMGILKIFN